MKEINRLLEEVCYELDEIGLDYLVVGGSALEARGYEIGIEDFVITPKGFDEIDDKLEKSSRFRIIDKIKTMIETKFFFENSWRTVEFLDPGYFSGERSPDEFIDYVKRYRSTKERVGYIVDPEVVFFMRLMVVDWEIYVQKIMRDIKAGLSIDLLQDVIRISENLGVKEKIEPRVEKTKEIIEVQME